MARRAAPVLRRVPVRGTRPRSTYDARVAALVRVLREAEVACHVQLPHGDVVRIPSKPPEVDLDRPWFRLIVHDQRFLRAPITELSLARAYVQGDLDIEHLRGDQAAIFRVRDAVRSGMGVGQALRLAAEVALVPPTAANARAIEEHYGGGHEVHLAFLDRRHRFYSQCLWSGGARSLEEAADAKLASMHEALGLRPGMRLLDVGGGWGGLAAYCAGRGVHATSLTLTHGSADHIRDRVAEVPRPRAEVEVRVEDLLEHRAEGRYDQAVIFGVIEHIPTYARVCEQLWRLLKPGGRLYLDASATREKYAGSAFTRAYTWTGPHSCLSVQDMVQELVLHGFEVERVRNETKDYERTMRAWARRLDAAHDAVARDWGETLYRQFRVFLWGGAQGLGSDRLQAYSIVARRPRTRRRPPPALARRTAQFVASLR